MNGIALSFKTQLLLPVPFSNSTLIMHLLLLDGVCLDLERFNFFPLGFCSLLSAFVGFMVAYETFYEKNFLSLLLAQESHSNAVCKCYRYHIKTDMLGFVALIAKPEALHMERHVFITTAFLHSSFCVIP